MRRKDTNAELWDSLSLDLICIQLEDKIVFINTAGVKLLGAPNPEQLVGRSIMDFVHPDCRELAASRVQQVTDKAEVCLGEETWLRFDGTAMCVIVAAAPFIYMGKPAVQFIAWSASSNESGRLAQRCKPGYLDSVRNVAHETPTVSDS